jgi:catechol 2,3-dioxygenase-like lactoylglutathione lyase family enzyme
MIVVSDVRASVAWYRALLRCSNDHDLPDFDRLMHGDRVLLMLHQRQAEEHGLPEPAPGAAGSGFLLWIYVSDFDRVYGRARRLKLTVVTEPHRNLQAGWREFTVRDPDGYRLAIAELEG